MFKQLACMFILCLGIFQAAAQRCDNKTETNYMQIVTDIHTLSDASKKYYQKHGEALPILCSNCKTRSLSLGEFIGALMGKAMKDAIGNKNFTQTKSIFDSLTKILATEAQQSILADFVCSQVNAIEYHCSRCHKVCWGKI